MDVWIYFALGIFLGVFAGNKTFRQGVMNFMSKLIGMSARGAKEVNKQYQSQSFYQEPPKLKQRIMKFYARSGSHFIHASEDCNALDNLEFMEITLEEAVNYNFKLCHCVYDKLNIRGIELTPTALKQELIKRNEIRGG
jgi:hypothetical protein